jgi:uncharacterized protein involved in type VI secretion and phage assembly
MFHGNPSTGIANKNLPWAYPAFASAGYEYGTFLVPEVGEWVFVIFENNSTDSPVYLGSSYGKGATQAKTYGSKDGQGQWTGEAGKNEVPTDAQRDEPTKKIIYKSPKGASVEIDEKDCQEQIAITDALGQIVKLESNLTDGVQHKRITGDVDSSGAACDKSSGSRVAVRAAGKQMLEMTTKDGVRDIKADLSDGYVIHIIDNNGSVSATYQHKNGSKIIMNDSGITIESSSQLSIKGAPSVNISGGQTVNVNGGNTVNVTGGNSVNVSAPGITLRGDVTIIGS